MLTRKTRTKKKIDKTIDDDDGVVEFNLLRTTPSLRQQLAAGGEGNVRHESDHSGGEDFRVDPRSLVGTGVADDHIGQSLHSLDVLAGTLGLADGSERFLVEQTDGVLAAAGLLDILIPADLNRDTI